MNRPTIQTRNIDGVWWLINADGDAFVSLGVNHLQSDCWLAPQNRSLMLERYGRDLDRGDGRFNPEGRALPKLVGSLAKRLKDLRFNTLGIHTLDVPARLFADDFYYGVAIEVHPLGSRFRFGEQTFPDIFAAEFEARLEQHIRHVVQEHRGHANLIGYAFSDIPRWYFYEGQSLDRQPVHPWVRDLLGLPDGAPGKAAVQEALGKAQAVTRADSDTALSAMVEHWYALHARLLRRHDPGRLLLGDKLHSPHRIPAWFEPILARHVDILFIQWYTPPETQREVLAGLHARTGLPILNGDSSFGCACPPHQSKVKGFPVDSKAAAGQAYAHYLETVMTWPFMLGWHHCGILEQWDGGKINDWEINENGFLNPFEEPYPEFTGPIRDANHKAVTLHTPPCLSDPPPPDSGP